MITEMIDNLERLPVRVRVIALTSILLDGQDATRFVRGESNEEQVMEEVVNKLATLPIEVRLPLVGTLMRRFLEN